MAAFTDSFENELLNYILGAGSYSRPTTWYLALYTAAPSEAGGGTECTGSGYARKAITRDNTNFPPTTTGEKNLGVALSFTEAANNWGTIVGWGLFADEATAGTLKIYGALDSPQIINQGDVARVAAGSAGLRITLD